MELSINYSTQAAVLFATGRIQVDRFKCPDWPALIAEAGRHRPVAVHFTLTAGRGRLAGKDLDKVARIADQTRTPFINLHLEAKHKDFSGVPINSEDPTYRELFFQQAAGDIDLAVRHFDRERVIVENVPYRPGGNVLRLAVEAKMIRRIVEDTGCGFLLDIPHARITAHHLAINELDYLCGLPVEHLKELHFTGVQNFGGWLQDHLPALQADWETLEWVLERIRFEEWPKPWMLAYEVGGVGEKFSWRTSAQSIEIDVNRLSRSLNQ